MRREKVTRATYVDLLSVEAPVHPLEEIARHTKLVERVPRKADMRAPHDESTQHDLVRKSDYDNDKLDP
jgi:hypothetical protein